MAKAKILLVEDSKVQAEVTKTFLERIGYEVMWVEDGKAAIKSSRTSQPDIILLDLFLPDISGNDVCRWLKLHEQTKGIPIIMLTARDSLEHKVRGLEAGADDYLPKPYNEIELNARIYACLRTKALQDELRNKNKQLEELLAKVEILAITDHLTGLFNRRRFETIFEKEIKRVHRYKTPFSCMMIDIDHFKRVNDMYGHKAGDAVLVEMASLLRDNVRDIDTAARWGGEEFIVLMPQTTKEDAVSPALRILKSVALHKFSVIQDSVTVSIGLANTDMLTSENGEKLIDSADRALYEAKRKGRNRIEAAWTIPEN